MTSANKPNCSPFELLHRRLSSMRELRQEDLAAVARFDSDVRSHPAGAELIPQIATAEEFRLIVAGFIGEIRMMSDGRRQIVSLHLPGDVVRLTAGPQQYALVALTPSQTVDASALARSLEDPAAERQALRAAWLEAQRAAHRAMLDHMVRLGRLSAYERTAHLFLELHERLLRVGLASAAGFHLPLTQEILADILGLSIVHVNRTLQQLRRDGLIAYRSGQIAFSDREQLALVAGYSLQLRPGPDETPLGVRPPRLRRI